MKKKLFSLLLVLTLVVSLSACGTPSPTEVTTTFLEAVKAQNTEDMASVYEDGSWSIFDSASDTADLEDMEGLDKYFTEEVLPKLLEFDYEILEEKIDGDKATVDVKITTYNLGNAFTTFFSEYLTQAFVLAFSNADDAAIDALGERILKEKVDTMEKTYTETVSISLSLVDDAWVIDELDDEGPLPDALVGGLIKAAAAIEDSFDL